MLELVDIAALTDALTRGHVAMIFNLNKRVLIAKHTLCRHNDQVKHLRLALHHLIGILLLQQEVSVASWARLALFLEELLELRTAIMITVTIQYDYLFGDLELSIDDEVDAIGPISLLIEHLVPVDLPQRQESQHVFLRVPRKLAD